MESNPVKCQEILEQSRQAGLLQALVMQFEKDFHRAGLTFPEWSDGDSDAQWVQRLREALYRILMEQTDAYMNLMYAVGVPERKFRGIPLTDTVEVADAATLLLLQREWEKVCLRTGYRSN